MRPPPVWWFLGYYASYFFRTSPNQHPRPPLPPLTTQQPLLHAQNMFRRRPYISHKRVFFFELVVPRCLDQGVGDGVFGWIGTAGGGGEVGVRRGPGVEGGCHGCDEVW